MRVAAIVPAAGKGKRINSRIEKPYIELCGKPIIAHTLIRLSKNKNIKEIITAVNKNKIDFFQEKIIDKFRIKKVRLAAGGRERKDSVFNALKQVSCDIDYILIHDGVRPNITNGLIDASLKAAERFGAAVTAVPVKATLKYVKHGFRIHSTPDRRNFWEAQTPQVFKRDLIEKAYNRFCKGINITDDSMLVEKMGIRPKVVMGSYSNIKITTKEDLKIIEALFNDLNDLNETCG